MQQPELNMNMNITPAVWGPVMWQAIHYVALGYPAEPTEQQKEAYLRFYYALGDVVPCGKCRGNYAQHLADLPPDGSLGGRDDLFAWTVALHNIVNQENGKPTVTTQQALDMCAKNVANSGRFSPGPRRDAWIPWAVGAAVVCVVLAVLSVAMGPFAASRLRSP